LKKNSLDNFSLTQENDVCIKIYNELLQTYKDCSKICYENKYLNIVGIFFPYLLRYFTGIYMKLNELSFYKSRTPELFTKYSINHFPFISYNELKDGEIKLNEKEFHQVTTQISNKMKILNFLSKRAGSRKIGLMDLGLNYYRFIPKLYKNFFSPIFLSDSKINIPEFERQYDLIDRFFTKFNKLVRLDYDLINAQIILKKFILSYLTDNKNKIDYKLLIVGTQLNMEARIESAKAMSLGFNVISISHGEGSELIGDEPRNGAGTLTYNDYFLNYGSYNDECIDDSIYNKGLFHKTIIKGSNSSICKKIFRPNFKIKKFDDFSSPYLMYVPTNFQFNLRQGPYHSIPDQIYYSWQKKMKKIFPHAMYKVHPKQKFKIDLKFSKTIFGSFEEKHIQADAYIFDCITTAFQIASATDKPIIYFDIGFRNLSDIVIDHIKERVLYINCNINDDVLTIENKIKNENEKKKSNNYVKNYCITDNHQNRHETLIELINSISF